VAAAAVVAAAVAVAAVVAVVMAGRRSPVAVATVAAVAALSAGGTAVAAQMRGCISYRRPYSWRAPLRHRSPVPAAAANQRSPAMRFCMQRAGERPQGLHACGLFRYATAAR
jgi:hypothetical protein